MRNSPIAQYIADHFYMRPDDRQPRPGSCDFKMVQCSHPIMSIMRGLMNGWSRSNAGCKARGLGKMVTTSCFAVVTKCVSEFVRLMTTRFKGRKRSPPSLPPSLPPPGNRIESGTFNGYDIKGQFQISRKLYAFLQFFEPNSYILFYLI